MTERNLWLKLLVTTFLAALAFYYMYPPSERLKGGIDLVGGTSLLYEIDDSGMANWEKQDLAKRVMRVLRRRVDPDNVRNLVWRPIGSNRLEIQMPQPPKEAQQRRDAYRQAQETLRATNIQPRQIEQALQQTQAARQQALDALAEGIPSRRPLLDAVADAYDTMQQATAGDDEQAKLDTTEGYESALDAVLETNIDVSDVSMIGALPTGSPTRQEQLARFKSQYHDRAALIDAALQAYDTWAEVRGALDDPADLQRLLRGAGVLEFRILAELDPQNPAKFDRYREQIAQRGPRASAGDQYGWFEIEKPLSFFHMDDIEQLDQAIETQATTSVAAKYAEGYYVLCHLSQEKGLLSTSARKWSLRSARPAPDPEQAGYQVTFDLDERGGSMFEVLTRENKGKRLCILLDDVAISAPTIQTTIRSSGRITGDFTAEEVNYLAQTLNAGALPARLKQTPISVKTIGPSLGKTNREMGTKAAMYGAVAVLAFMGVYYLFSGIVVNIAVAMNLLLVLGMMAAMNATWTLPGIAGLALMVGMAVDANVLINERIREELGRGVSLRLAIKTGYEKAFSAILDSNVTTIITCVILGYFGSEEVKGFALTLGLGLVCNVYTSVFVTRWIVTGLVQMRALRSLPMLRLIGVPDIDWMGRRRVFQAVSVVLVVAGLSVFFVRGNDKYDIEFRGGVSAQIELKPGLQLSDVEVRERVTGEAAHWLGEASKMLAAAEVTSDPAMAGVFTIDCQGLTATQLESFVLQAIDSDETKRGHKLLAKDGVEEVGAHVIRITTMAERADQDESDQQETTQPAAAAGRYVELGEMRDLVTVAANRYAERAGRQLGAASVQIVKELGAEAAGETFEIITTEQNQKVVRDAILAVMSDQLNIEGAVNFAVRTDPVLAADGMFPIESRRLTTVINDPSATGDARDYLGGVAIVLDELSPPQTEQQITRRLRDMRLQPDFEQSEWREFKVLGLKKADQPGQSATLYESAAIIVVDPALPFDEDEAAWRRDLAQTELQLVRSAMLTERSLQKVTQFGSQVASQAANQALLAMVLALLAIVVYIWLRFGTPRHGLAAIVALVHDVSIALGAVAVAHFIARTPVGTLLGITDFRIDLAMVAAFLTLIGYSLNDTIVVFDRIRENRGKLTTVSAPLVNSSINQMLGRTILTSVTTLAVVGILYVFGGQGIHGISFALLIGVLVGTYSSIAVASPLLLTGTRSATAGRR
ncbi:MAG TPA: protein translocase subunit SecD [Phycisphaerae bacterium]|nr:protein translocase subunit SecD [Phycisphaerae bacterium]